MSGLSKMIADFFVRENVIEHEEIEVALLIIWGKEDVR